MKKNLIKSGVAVLCLVVASMFGFQAAIGYGGSGGGSSVVSSCSSVTYADWQACIGGVQYRNVIAQNPFNCQLTASQQAGRSQSCTATVTPPTTSGEGQVLGEKKYADGTLLRGSNGRTYIVVGGKLQYIPNLATLAKYAGKEIVKVDSSVINAFQMVNVLGAKKYGDGQLIRNDDVKVFVILNGKKKHILNLDELRTNYFGKSIYKVTAEELEQY
jgi:hypothetical protein